MIWHFSFLKANTPPHSMYAIHSYTIHTFSSTLSKHTQRGSWEGGQSFMLSQLLSGVPQLSTPSTPHTLYPEEKASLQPVWGHIHVQGTATRHTLVVSWVSCFCVTTWSIHFGDFNLHRRWDWGFGSDTDGDLILWRLNLRLQLETCRERKKKHLGGIPCVITHTLGCA